MAEHYERVPQWATPPPCSRCGSSNTSWDEEGRTIWRDAEGQCVCENCTTAIEKIAYGETIVAGLEERIDELRKAWLSEDYVNRNPDDFDRIRQKHGEPPEEMRRLLDVAEEMDETLNNMRYVAESDAALLHHQVTGQWPRL